MVSCAPERSPIAPALRNGNGSANNTYTDFFDGAVFVCKAGGPAGTYQFHLDVSGGGVYELPYGNDLSIQFDGTNLACLQAWTPTHPDSWLPDVTGTLTFTEVPVANMKVDSILVRDSRQSVFWPAIKNTNTVSLTVDAHNNYYYVKYYNSPLPPIVANCVAVTATQGVALSPVQLSASGGNGGPYTFTATGLPAGVTLSTSGVLSGTPTVSGTFNYTVTVTDSDGNSATSGPCAIVVSPPAIVANCVAVTAVKNVALTPVQLTASGGNGGPYTFTATGLPAGVTLSTSGVLSGTPTVSGTFNYTVTVTDSDGNSTTSSPCAIVVSPPPQIVANCVAVTAVQGVALTPVQLTASGGNGGPYTFTATGLPAGVTLSTSGVLSGTPTVSGTFNYTVTVTDSDGNSTTTRPCAIVVSPPPPQFCSYTPGGWGAPPSGGNVASILYANWSAVYGSAGVTIGSTAKGYFYAKWTSPSAVTDYLPDGSTPGTYLASYTNPVTTSAGEFSSQVLALRFNVNFSSANIIKPGFSSLKVASGPLAGLTTTQVLALANSAISGNTSVLTPYGITVAQFTKILSYINGSYDNCLVNTGYLQ